MKDEKLIIIIIVIIIVIMSLVVKFMGNPKYDVDNFEHRNFSGLEFEKYNVTEDYEVPADCYWSTQDLATKGGDYFAAKMYFENEPTIIEENTIKYIDDGGADIETVESVLYSDQELDKEHAGKYLNQMHDGHACGVDLRTFKHIKDHYYYVKYQIPGEC